MSIESVILSTYLILCCPFLFFPSIYLSIRVCSSELALHIRWPKYWSFSFSISSSNEYLRLFSFRIDSFDLLAVQGALKSCPEPHFKSINSLVLSLVYGPTFTSVHAAAKSLQLCLTLCNPIDGSPPGSAFLGILQARTLEWVAISFSNAWKWKMKVKSLSRVQPSATPWTAAFQAPPSMGFSKQEYWSGLPLPSDYWPNHSFDYTGLCQEPDVSAS